MSTDEATNGATGPPDPAAEDGWKIDKQKRKFVAARGRSGIVYRQGNETVEEALARDAKGPRDKPPKKKKGDPAAAAATAAAVAGKGPAPSKQGLKELEHALAEGLRAPAMAAAMVGDEWLAEHFMKQGPVLARNLVMASEHNPWLRAKLEAAMQGEDIMIKVMTMMTVGGAVIGYVVPPIIYLVNPPFVSEKAREMFGVPERRPDHEEGPRAPATPPAHAAGAAGAAAATG